MGYLDEIGLMNSKPVDTPIDLNAKVLSCWVSHFQILRDT